MLKFNEFWVQVSSGFYHVSTACLWVNYLASL